MLTSSRPIIPILLAGGSHLDQWPRSRINLPIQFQSDDTGSSPFERTLVALSKLPVLNPPILCLPSATHDIAREQLAALNLGLMAKLIVEPVDRGSLPALLTAALQAATVDKTALLVIIDAADPPTDWEAFGRLLGQMTNNPLAQGNLVAAGQPQPAGAPNLPETVSKSSNTIDPLTFGATAASGEQTYRLGSVCFASPATLLQQFTAKKDAPLAACNTAFQSARILKDALWPDINLWSPIKYQTLGRALALSPDSFLLRPVDLKASGLNVQRASRNIYQNDCNNCSISSDGHLVVAAGCEDLDIVSMRDATLISRKGNSEALAPILAKLRAHERSELFDFPSQSQTWGTETQIDHARDFSIFRLEVEPGQSIAPHFHTKRFENWHVLSGQASARFGDRVRQLVPGLSYDIPRNTVHSCTNQTNEPLIILETRHGTNIQSNDYHKAELTEEITAA